MPGSPSPTSLPPRRILLRHVGNMGDHLFLVGPALEVLARRYPLAEITLVTAWGYKNDRGQWGDRNQDGFCIALMKENPHIDQLVQWHDHRRSLDGELCIEEGVHFPTWDPAWYEHEKPHYDLVAELDFGLGVFDNPLERVYERLGLPNETDCSYPFYGSANDWAIGRAVAKRSSRPRVVFLEGIGAESMRGWDPAKAQRLEELLTTRLGISLLRFGARSVPSTNGRRLTLRENIAFVGSCDLAVGVMSGPMHFAAAAGVPTICLYGGQPLHRAAPSYFLNPHILDPERHHITIEGPTCDEPCFLKRDRPCKNLSAEAARTSGFQTWQHPGRQDNKSCVATIPVETVYATILTALRARGLLGSLGTGS